MSCTWSLLSLAFFDLMSSSCLILGQHILKECYSDFVETLVLLFCLPVTIQKRIWQLLIFWLSRHEWRMDISLQTNKIHLCCFLFPLWLKLRGLSLSYPWRPPPPTKESLASRADFWVLSFIDCTVFFVETALVVAQGFQTILRRINDPVNRCLK